MKSDDIDALARLLDGDLAGGEAPAEARALGAFAKALEGSAAAAPTFAGKADLRAMLLEAAREQAAAPTLLARIRGTVNDATTRWRYSTRLAAATGASAMALSSGGVALAAQQATPGHPLYGVKLVLEEGHLWFIGDDVERGEQRLANAVERLAEARLAAEAGDMAGAERALREADESSRRGAGNIIAAAQEQGEPSLLNILTAFSEEQRDRLLALQPLLEGEAATAAENALVALNRIDQRVAVLGGSCGGCEDAAQPADNGGNKGNKGGGKSNGKGAQNSAGGAAVAVSDVRDFDFTQIPPADEPFSACPCVSGPTTSTPAGATDTEEAEQDVEEEVDQKPDRKPPKGDPPADPEDPTDEEPPAEEPDPSPVPEPVDEVLEEASEIVDDVLEELPTDPPPDVPDTPDLPPIPPPPSGGPDLPDAPEVP